MKVNRVYYGVGVGLNDEHGKRRKEQRYSRARLSSIIAFMVGWAPVYCVLNTVFVIYRK